MQALILAAGLGSRLKELSASKPLTPVAGIAMLELGIRQAARAGASGAIVVTGHHAERIEAALPGFAHVAGIPVAAHRVENSLRPNGYSVMVGASRIEGDYLLMMADHIFSLAILRDLAKQGGADRGVTLAIDRRTDNALVDPKDATWVQTRGDGFIRSIGKTIPDYDAVDCGAFLATPELAPAIAAAIADGRPGSLSDGMQRLAAAGRAATMDIGNAWWIDVDDPRAHALAEAQVAAELPDIYGARPVPVAAAVAGTDQLRTAARSRA